MEMTVTPSKRGALRSLFGLHGGAPVPVYPQSWPSRARRQGLQWEPEAPPSFPEQPWTARQRESAF